MEKKTILFLSALDFKEKSIQVIKKTPEAFVKAGWEVHYVVGRDTSKYGNYFYENVVNPEGIKVYRFEWPLRFFRDNIKNHMIRTFLNKLSSYFVILKLAYYGAKILKNYKIDIVYGYEIHGVLAANILKILKKIKKQKIVSRFQGTFYIIIIKQKHYLKAISNWEHFLALKLPSDLCIMTDDGTQGDQALKYVRSKSLHNMKFWVNGVDEQKLSPYEIEIFKMDQNLSTGDKILLTVCRLEKWKRVDRCVRVLEILVKKYNLKKIKYYIVGEGKERGSLEELVREKNLLDHVIFVGAVKHEEVKKYLNIADIFISTYDSSNVGNPLLEAIRANKIIFTLNNGDTNKWIQHEVNGFIYDIDENLYENMAKDIYRVLFDYSLRNKIIDNIKKTEKEKLWTWEERMNAEVLEVEKLIYEG